MIKHIALIAFIVLLPIRLVAQTDISIKSGEHADFSRLVIYFSKPAKWRVDKTTNGIALKTEDSIGKVQDEDVFSFIPKSRITGISYGESQIGITTNCDCTATVIEYEPDVVVVDVMNSSGVPIKWPDRGQATTISLGKSTVKVGGAEADSLSKPGSQGIEFPILPIPGARKTMPNQDASVEKSEPLAPILSVRATEDATLARRLGIAASKGFLTPKANSFSSPNLPDPDAGHVLTTVSTGTRYGNVEYRDPELFATGASDSGGRRREGDCFPASYFDFAVGRSLPATDVVARGRIGLANSAENQFDAESVRFAKSLVSQGFGAEASEVLSGIDSTKETEILRMLATLVDEPSQLQSQELFHQLGCSNGSAVWALLSAPSDALIDISNEKEIYKAYLDLPDTLRLQLSRALGQKLELLGNVAFANSIFRSEVAPLDGMTRLQTVADLAISEMEVQADRMPPESSRQSNLGSSAAQGESVGESGKPDQSYGIRSEFLESEAHVFKGTKEGGELVGAYISSLLERGDYLAAMQYIDRLNASNFFSRSEASFYMEQVVRDLLGAKDIGALVFADDAFDLIGENSLISSEAQGEMLSLIGGISTSVDVQLNPGETSKGQENLEKLVEVGGTAEGDMNYETTPGVAVEAVVLDQNNGGALSSIRSVIERSANLRREFSPIVASQ